VVVSLVGWTTLTTKIKESPYVKSAENLGSPAIDIIRAMLVMASPVFLLFLMLSFLNQIVRKIRWTIGLKWKREKEIEASESARENTRGARGSRCGDGWPVTRLTKSWLRHLDTWKWTKVMQWSNFFVIAYWAVKLGSIWTNLASNVLITALSTLPWGVTCVLFIVIGLVMFLIPIVPGPVVYLTSGLLVVPVVESAFGGRQSGGGACNVNATLVNLTLGSNLTSLDADAGGEYTGSHGPFWIGCAIANLISWSLKLVAHVMQQKLIGETLSRNVGVRAMVSPNSKVMKTIRVLLQQPGFTLAKCSIMCGGPDWPTSVICGFLKLPVGGLLLGLVPMFFMTIPTTLAGAFMNPPSPSPYESITSFLFLIVMFITLFYGVMMMQYLSKVSQEEIDAVPIDVEVEKLDRKTADMNLAVERSTEFSADPKREISGLPCYPKFLLCSASLLLLFTLYALLAMPESLFQPFGLTACISTFGTCENGICYNFPFSGTKKGPIGISWLGAFAMLIFIFANFEMWLFGRWAKTKAKAELNWMREKGMTAAADLDADVEKEQR